jgi:hypothetical protein
MAHLTFDAEVDRLDWIAAYPGAHNPGPNGGWDAHARCAQPGVNDVAFIRDVTNVLKLVVPRDRIELSTPGFSVERTDVRRRPLRSTIVFGTH